MDHKLTLTVAIANVNSTLEVLKDNPSFDIISANLNSVKLILENQSQKLESTVDITEDYTDPKKPKFYGKIRKISLVVPLSDPRTYKGGNFQFWSGKTLTIKEGRKQGSLLFFPSYLWHRVTPITEGIRYSLVAWICGDPFV